MREMAWSMVRHSLRTWTIPQSHSLLYPRENDIPFIQGGVLWLERTVQDLRSPWSMAWAVLALAAHGRPVEPLLTCLRSLPDLSALEDTSTLAVVALALDCPGILSGF